MDGWRRGGIFEMHIDGIPPKWLCYVYGILVKWEMDGIILVKHFKRFKFLRFVFVLELTRI